MRLKIRKEIVNRTSIQGAHGFALRRRGHKLVGLPLALFVALSGCSVGPDFIEPGAPPVKGYLPTKLKTTDSARVFGGDAQRFFASRDVSGKWWRAFKSPQINAFVQEALVNHPDLAAAQAALRQAREIQAADTGSLFPSITTSDGVTRERASPAQLGQAGPGSTFTLFNASVPVSYVPDIWGGRARAVEADQAAAEAQEFQLEATYLSLIGNVITAAISDATYAAQISVTKDLIAKQQESVDLLEQQFKLGAVSEADVLQQRSQLAASQATLPPLAKARAIGRDQLMTYLGRFPSQDKGETVNLDTLNLPSDLPLSLPSMLVRQRPDVRAAESQVHQAAAEVGVATANMLPQFAISASGGSQALKFNQLLTSNSNIWSIGASVTSPIFDAGGLFHTREARSAAFEQTKAKYKSTVLTAFQNVADSLRAIQYDAELLKAQLNSETTAAASLKVSQEQYKAGAGTILNVLNAQQTLLTARTSRVKAEGSRYSDTVALFTALGGGYWNRKDVTEQANVKSPGIAVVSEPVAALTDLHASH